MNSRQNVANPLVKTMVATIMMMAFTAESRPAHAQITEITSCSILTQPGTYGFRNIIATGNGACIVVDGPNILVENGVGSGGRALLQGSASGIGIRFQRAHHSSLAVFAGVMIITGFDTAIVIKGEHVHLHATSEGGLVILNSRVGIKLKNATAATIGCSECPSSTQAGAISINSSEVGVLVTGQSTSDIITGTVNQHGYEIPPIGIEVRPAASNITISENSTEGAIIDRHSNCEMDIWQNNTFVSANQSCLQQVSARAETANQAVTAQQQVSTSAETELNQAVTAQQLFPSPTGGMSFPDP